MAVGMIITVVTACMGKRRGDGDLKRYLETNTETNTVFYDPETFPTANCGPS